MPRNTPVRDTQQPEDTPAPDVHLTSADPFCSDLEERRGLQIPAQYFAIIGSALRHHQGLGIEEHCDKVAAVYSSFSEVAAANPHAWRREPMTAEEIRNATGKNASRNDRRLHRRLRSGGAHGRHRHLRYAPPPTHSLS